MGIYVFTWKKLREYLIADEADPASDNDFGKNIIPTMLKNGEKMAAYRFEGYWKDVGTLGIDGSGEEGVGTFKLVLLQGIATLEGPGVSFGGIEGENGVHAGQEHPWP